MREGGWGEWGGWVLGGVLSKSIEREKIVTKIFFSDNIFKFSSKF